MTDEYLTTPPTPDAGAVPSDDIYVEVARSLRRHGVTGNAGMTDWNVARIIENALESRAATATTGAPGGAVTEAMARALAVFLYDDNSGLAWSETSPSARMQEHLIDRARRGLGAALAAVQPAGAIPEPTESLETVLADLDETGYRWILSRHPGGYDAKAWKKGGTHDLYFFRDSSLAAAIALRTAIRATGAAQDGGGHDG